MKLTIEQRMFIVETFARGKTLQKMYPAHLAAAHTQLLFYRAKFD
jgi:hypothetical protein